jgi:uncharacterized membrane protein YphA (DoxX/SURF4 family)
LISARRRRSDLPPPRLVEGRRRGTGPAAFAADIAANYGIPAFLGYLAAYAEMFGAILLIVGLLTRLDALLLAATMFVAAFIVQLPEPCTRFRRMRSRLSWL